MPVPPPAAPPRRGVRPVGPSDLMRLLRRLAAPAVRLRPLLAALAAILLLLPAPAPAAAAQEPTGPPPPEQTEAESATPADLETAAAELVEDPTGWQKSADDAMGKVNGWFATVIFFDVWFWDNETVVGEDGEEQVDLGINLRLAVLILVAGAIFFTLRMGFVNLRGFGHAITVVRGHYDDPNEPGEVSHFQALAAALSATVGLGNIAGVAIAVGTGGPGATFWMIIAGVLGMASKFTECTLGQMYREVRPDGRVMGGAMFYLSKGLGELGLGGFGKVLAVLFAFLCIGGSLAGGNAFQVRQSMDAVAEAAPWIADYNVWYGLILAVLVGVVIIGGVQRIARTAEKIVPLMCTVYVLACLFILVKNYDHVLDAFSLIVSGAFTPEAGYGGLLGVLVVGFQRAAFSNEAGVGSAAIAHSAAKTEYPVREGIVALLEPFIDTVVVCTMTALVIVITGAYNNPEYADLITGDKGAALTSRAMGEEISWFPYLLGAATILFAFSTMISWSYYGERCWSWMFGDGSSNVYKLLFCVFTFLGAIITATNVLAFGDLMILGMAIPNVIGVVLLSGKVRRALSDYWSKLKAGELPQYK